MIRLFRKSGNKETSPIEFRLRSMEWKVNLLLGLVTILLIAQLVSFLTSIGRMFIPTPTTVALILVVLIAAGYFFRHRIPGIVKRMFQPKSQTSDYTSDEANRKSPDLDESIR